MPKRAKNRTKPAVQFPSKFFSPFQLRKLLEKSMKERVDTYPERQKILKLIKAEEEDSDEDAPRIHRQITKGKEGYTPYINEEADLPTIHEAYQFLVKTYIENVLIRKQRKSSVMKKSRAVNAFIKSPQHGPKNDKNGVDNEDKKKEKKKKKKTKKDELDEENQKLLSQIEDMVGGLGIDDPLQGGSSVSRSRRGSRVPIPGKLNETFLLGEAFSVIFKHSVLLVSVMI